MKIVLMLLTALSLAGLVLAQEPAGEGRRPPEGANRAPIIEEFLQNLRENNPTRYRELMQLRQRDPQQFRQEVLEMARARAGEGRGPLGPAGGDRPRFGLQDLEEGQLADNLFRRGLDGRFLEQLERTDPETHARLLQLRDDDPEAYRKELREHFEERVRRFRGGPQVDEETRELLQLYRRSRNAAEQLEIRARIRERVEAQFDRQMEAHEESVTRLAEQLEQARKALAERREAREQLIDEQVANLLTPRPEQPRPGEVGEPGERRPPRPGEAVERRQPPPRPPRE